MAMTIALAGMARVCDDLFPRRLLFFYRQECLNTPVQTAWKRECLLWCLPMDRHANSGLYRFYLPGEKSIIVASQGNSNQSEYAGQLVEVDQLQAHHARKVLRLREGDLVEVFDGRGGSGTGKIIGWHNGMQVQVLKGQFTPRLKPRLVVASAVPKGSHAQEMVNQMSQVGVDAWQPMHTERSVVEPGEGKMDRFARIAVEAARQCGRAHLMEIQPPLDYQQVLHSTLNVNQLKLIACADGQPLQPQTDDLNSFKALVLIGPEGGWTEHEIVQARQFGFQIWRMGPHVMRIETACVAAGTLLRYLLSSRETGQ